MNRCFARKNSPSASPERNHLERAINATMGLAEYARAQHLPEADDLLTAVIAALFAPSVELSQEELIEAENRAIDALQLLWEPIQPD